MQAMKWPGQMIQLHNADDQTADWIAKARTPETGARIRRWSRMETIGAGVALAGIALFLLALIATVALVIWFAVAGIERTDVYWWLWGFAGGVLLAGGILMGVSGHRRLTACFADGYVSTGRVDRVIECPGGGDDSTWYELRVSAQLSDGVVLHRKVYRDGANPRRRIGGPIRFRHNTLDPDDAHDVLFGGFPGADTRSPRS
ncbi:phage holin family protein [Streptomyces sp. NPDC050560]|uniref:phage holin family protein n=1 Tax=Streptomyces sp. NPDC050560 TaxID=3365630 RepID=UPI003796B9F7